MHKIGDSLLERFQKDPNLKGAHQKAVNSFIVKILNLLREGHIVDNISFYWTHGTQYRPGSGPHLRAIMDIDGKSNRFWFYPGWFMMHHYGWQNVTKQNKRKKQRG